MWHVINVLSTNASVTRNGSNVNHVAKIWVHLEKALPNAFVSFYTASLHVFGYLRGFSNLQSKYM